MHKTLFPVLFLLLAACQTTQENNPAADKIKSSPVTVNDSVAGKEKEDCCAKKTAMTSVITCPYCGFKKEEPLPTDECRLFYECTNCRKKIAPKEGDCCVFCSYGSVKCPSKQ